MGNRFTRDKRNGVEWKRKPKTTTYSYSISFAVAISSRPISKIGRIWADGNLLRGAAGDLKTPGTLRIYDGHGEQANDPLTASAIGPNCPAFRNIAYAEFENLQLGDFGNRIPTLSFEVVADPIAEFSLGDLVPFAIQSDSAIPELRGFSDRGGSIGQTLQSLNRVFPISCDASEEGLILSLVRDTNDGLLPMLPSGLAQEASRSRPNDHMRQRSAATLPEPRALRYFDIGRDYQAGVQRTVGIASAGPEIMLELPAAMDASTARNVCNQQTLGARWQRDKLSWEIAQLDEAFKSGAHVRVPDAPGQWMIRDWEWLERGVSLELERIAPSLEAKLETSAGSSNTPLDVLASGTELALVELPWDGIGAPSAPHVYAAASGTGPVWRGAALFVNQGGSLLPSASQISGRATIGALATELPSSPSLSLEHHASVDIEFSHGEANLRSTTVAGLAGGANRIAVGGEVLQYLCAEAIDEKRWKLSGLLRGRGGTEGSAYDGHVTGSQVIFIDAALIALDPSEIASNDYAEIAAIGLADAEPVYSSLQLSGLSRNPLPPVHTRRAVNPDGSWTLCWTRRARGQWQWNDLVDLPLVEETETYLVGVGSTKHPAVSWQVGTTQLTLTSDQVLNLITEQHGAALWIKQVGSFGISKATLITNIP